MISKADARAIVYGLDASRLARAAYRAAYMAAGFAWGNGEDGNGRPTVSPFRAAVVVLDLRSGAVRVRCFHEADPVALPFHLVALSYVDVALVEDIERRHGEGCVLQPSLELLEEAAAREAAADGVGVSWALLEAQLRLSYDDFDPDEYYPERHRAGEHGEGR